MPSRVSASRSARGPPRGDPYGRARRPCRFLGARRRTCRGRPQPVADRRCSPWTRVRRRSTGRPTTPTDTPLRASLWRSAPGSRGEAAERASAASGTRRPPVRGRRRSGEAGRPCRHRAGTSHGPSRSRGRVRWATPPTPGTARAAPAHEPGVGVDLVGVHLPGRHLVSPPGARCRDGPDQENQRSRRVAAKESFSCAVSADAGVNLPIGFPGVEKKSTSTRATRRSPNSM